MATRSKVTPIPPAEVERVHQEAEKAKSLVEEAQKAFAEDVLTGIHAKMAYIMASMRAMAPEGKNAHFRYNYWSTDQLTGYFRARFGELGISFTADVENYDIREHATSKEGRSYLTTIMVRFTLVDSATGETVSGVGIGQGDDPSDKGSNKAMAGALKYWLLKTFLMGGEDAEADTRTDERSVRTAEKPVNIGPSSIAGIGRGGRANKATDAQISQIRHLAADLGWNAIQAAVAIADWLGEEWEIPSEPEQAGPALIRALEALSADDAGKVVTEMINLRDAEKEHEENSFGEYGS